MTMIFSHASQCAGKEPFATPQLAHDVARRRQREHKNNEAYRCAHCGFWHIGARLRKPKKAGDADMPTWRTERKAKLRKRLFKRDGNACFYCGRELWIEPKPHYNRGGKFMWMQKPNATIEHLLDRSLGGRFTMANLVLAHEYCNSPRAQMTLEEKLASRGTYLRPHLYRPTGPGTPITPTNSTLEKA